MKRACGPGFQALLHLLLACLQQPSHALQLGVVLGGEAVSSGRYDLGLLSDALRDRGHDVQGVAAAGQDNPDWEAAITQPEGLHPAFDALLAAGQSAMEGEASPVACTCCIMPCPLSSGAHAVLGPSGWHACGPAQPTLPAN